MEESQAGVRRVIEEAEKRAEAAEVAAGRLREEAMEAARVRVRD